MPLLCQCASRSRFSLHLALDRHHLLSTRDGHHRTVDVIGDAEEECRRGVTRLRRQQLVRAAIELPHRFQPWGRLGLSLVGDGR